MRQLDIIHTDFHSLRSIKFSMEGNACQPGISVVPRRIYGYRPVKAIVVLMGALQLLINENLINGMLFDGGVKDKYISPEIVSGEGVVALCHIF